MAIPYAAFSTHVVMESYRGCVLRAYLGIQYPKPPWRIWRQGNVFTTTQTYYGCFCHGGWLVRAKRGDQCSGRFGHYVVCVVLFAYRAAYIYRLIYPGQLVYYTIPAFLFQFTVDGIII